MSDLQEDLQTVGDCMDSTYCAGEEDMAAFRNVRDTITTLQERIAEQGEWVSVQTKLPEYGEPVLLVASGVIQNVTWFLDGADDTPDWFEPHHFDHEDSLKMWWNDATHWMYVNALPSPPKEADKTDSIPGLPEWENMK